MSAPARFDFVGPYAAARGLSFAATVVWRNADGDPISLVDLAPRLLVWTRPDAPTVLLDCTVDNDRVVVSEPADGVLSLAVDVDTMTALPAGRHVYRLQLEAESGAVIGLLAGHFDVLRAGEGAVHGVDGSIVVRGETSIVVVSHGVITSGSGVSDHGDLTGRDAADSHPIGGITGLQAQLTALTSSIAGCSTTGQLAAVVGDLATVAANLAAHLASSSAHTLAGIAQSGASTGQVPRWSGTAWVPVTPSGLPAGGTLNRTLRKLSATDGDADFSGRAIRASDPATETMAAELIVATSAMAYDRHGLQVKYGDSQFCIVGGTDNGVGTVPLFCAAYSGASAYDITGIYRRSGGTKYGLGAYSHSFPGGQFGFGHFNCINLCSAGIDAPAVLGGNTYMTIAPCVSEPSATPTDYAVLLLDPVTGKIKVKTPAGPIETLAYE